MTDDQIKGDAIAFAKANKKNIARRLCSKEQYPPEKDPVSIFMAWSPGAGKTEASIELIDAVGPTIRIDPDDLRSEFPMYNGGNAHLFQPAVSIIVYKMIDFVFDNDQSFLLDGTLDQREQSSIQHRAIAAAQAGGSGSVCVSGPVSGLAVRLR